MATVASTSTSFGIAASTGVTPRVQPSTFVRPLSAFATVRFAPPAGARALPCVALRPAKAGARPALWPAV
jgi:hypothetical protein